MVVPTLQGGLAMQGFGSQTRLSLGLAVNPPQCAPNSHCEVAAALLVRGELFGGRGPRAEVRGRYQSLRKASEAAAAYSQTCFPDPELDRFFIHLRSPNCSRSARTCFLNEN